MTQVCIQIRLFLFRSSHTIRAVVGVGIVESSVIQLSSPDLMSVNEIVKYSDEHSIIYSLSCPSKSIGLILVQAALFHAMTVKGD